MRSYLASKSWETRVAASQAVEAIARNVKKWDPSYQPSQVKDSIGEGSTPPPPPALQPDTRAEYLTFETFDITQVLWYHVSV